MTSFNLLLGWGTARLVPIQTLIRDEREVFSYASDGTVLAWRPGIRRPPAIEIACDVERSDEDLSDDLLGVLDWIDSDAVRLWTRLETACKMARVPVVEAVLRPTVRRQLLAISRTCSFMTVEHSGKTCTFGLAIPPCQESERLGIEKAL